VVVVIGVFSISELLLMLQEHHSNAGLVTQTGRMLFNWKELKATWWGTLRSSVVGFAVGVLPGAGATIASAMTYSMEKSLTDKEGTFGQGDIRGVAAPEAANNSAATGSFVPMLTLGVPGSGTTAVMVGALSLYNITPGPALFTQQPDLVWGLIASLFVANVILLVLNIPLVGVFTKVLSVPNWLLVPGIVAVSSVGVYAVHATTFDLVLMTALGFAAYLLRKQGIPMAPLILGFVLGDMMEQNLRRALSISNGDAGILVGSPISVGLWVAAALMLVVPLGMRMLSRRHHAEAAAT
jgi:putative tricarboxylic transport membrane protein